MIAAMQRRVTSARNNWKRTRVVSCVLRCSLRVSCLLICTTTTFRIIFSFSSLLRGRPVGRITRLARPSVRLSVHPSVPAERARNWKTKKRRKVKIGVDVPPHGTSKYSANFQFERSKMRVTGLKKLPISQVCGRLYLASSLLTGGAPADQGNGTLFRLTLFRQISLCHCHAYFTIGA